MMLEIRMQSRPGEGEKCCVARCRNKCSGRHSLPFFNGDIVSNEWLGDWCGAPCCEACYDMHAAGKMKCADSLYGHYLDSLGACIDGAGI